MTKSECPLMAQRPHQFSSKLGTLFRILNGGTYKKKHDDITSNIEVS